MMTEATLHRLLKDNEDVKKRFLKILNIKGENIVFNSEDQYPNGMFADFTILVNDEVKAIVELKGSDIGVNDYVRGTGQIFQYQHFIDLNMSIKSYVYRDAVAVYCFPSSLIAEKNYNIGLFAYPKNCVILEFNEENYTFRRIALKDLKVFAGSRGKEMVTVSPYYIRDTRLFELYIALRYFNIKKMFGEINIDRKAADTFLRQLNTPDNGNWRNVFISLSSLGLTDENNIPTDIGSQYASMDFAEFAYEVYNSYIRNYFQIIWTNLFSLGAASTPITLAKLKESIDFSFHGREVLFLTDSGTRYLSSWLNIMRDDFGCIDFKPKQSLRTYSLIYPIDSFNKKAICQKVKSKSIAYFFIAKFNDLMKAKL